MKLRARQRSACLKSSAPHFKNSSQKHHTKKKAPIPITTKSQLYEVEKITEKRLRKFGWEYFVSWVGYPSSDDMWISECPPFFKKEWESKIQHVTAPDFKKIDSLVAEACRRLQENQ